MEFRIASSFESSLTRLTNDEQKATKTTVFDLQLNPESPGLSFHKLNRAKDERFWSVRVSRDIRLIVHRMDSSILVCYVGHHDDAYDWAERRKLDLGGCERVRASAQSRAGQWPHLGDEGPAGISSHDEAMRCHLPTGGPFRAGGSETSPVTASPRHGCDFRPGA